MTAPIVVESPATGGVSPRGRGDAFDPSQTPGAPGAPRVLGSMDRNAALSGPLGVSIIDEGPSGDPNAPLDHLNPRRPPQRTVAAPASAPDCSASTPTTPSVTKSE